MLPAICTFLLIFLFYLVIKKDKIQAEVAFPWFLLLILLGFVSIFDEAIIGLARIIGIVYPPVAILLLILLIFFITSIGLAISLTKMRHRQIMIIRELAKIQLFQQEMDRKQNNR